MRSHRTAIYVLSSLLVGVSGIVVLQAYGKTPTGLSIATSLIAGGLTSVGFVLIRYFDETDASRVMVYLREELNNLSNRLHDFDKALEGLHRLSLLSEPVDARRVFDRHPEDETREEIHAIHGRVELDVMGLALMPFCQDHIAYLRERGNVAVRLLIQDPSAPTFAAICRQEGRDLEAMIRDAIVVTRSVLQYHKGTLPRLFARATIDVEGSPVPEDEDLDIQVRWWPNHPSIAITRVNGVMFVRARFLREATHPRMFFERYVKDEGIPFEAYQSYFMTAWNEALSPTVSMCDRISNMAKLANGALDAH